MDFRKAEAFAGLRGRDSARKVFNVVLSTGLGNDLIRTVEISQTDQIEIDATVTQILPILESIDSRLIYATLADLGIKLAAKKDEVHS